MITPKISLDPNFALRSSAVAGARSPKSPLLDFQSSKTTRENTLEEFKKNSFIFQGQHISKQQSFLRKTVGSPRNIDRNYDFNYKLQDDPMFRQTSFISPTVGQSGSGRFQRAMETGGKRSATGQIGRQISSGPAVKKQSSYTTSGESNYDRIMEKLDKKQKLINELKKLSQIKISEKLRYSYAVDYDRKIELNRSMAQGGSDINKKDNNLDKTQIKNSLRMENSEKVPDKNPEDGKNNFQKNKGVYYTPKTEKPQYQHKIEKRWTPKPNNMSFTEQIMEKMEKLKEINIPNSFSFIPQKEGFSSPLGNLTGGIDLKLLGKDFTKEYKSIKQIRQISEAKTISNNIKNNSNIFTNKKLSLKDFRLGKVLGDGKFGKVYQAIHKQTLSLYALKKVSKETIKSNYMIEQFILQIKIQNFCNNQNILKLYGFFDDNQHIYLILQYMEEGTLYSHLKKNKILPEAQAAQKLKQIARAVNYLHEKGIAHRDIKPENIVMSYGVGKLCDFGWAAICNQRRKTYCGTFDYAAPQILQGSQYDMSVDLWCLGVLAYQLLVGKAPFYHISRKETMKKILNVNLTLSQVASTSVEFPLYLSKTAVTFIENLIRKRPEERMNGEEVLKHPFLYQVDQDGKL